MKNNKIFLIITLVMSITVFSQNQKWLNKSIDLKNIEVRKDSFTMMQNNKAIGYWLWQTEKNNDEIIFNDVSVLTDLVKERFQLKFNINKLVTKSVDMKMDTKRDSLSVTIYRNSTKELKAKFNRKGRINKETVIDTTYSEEVVLRSEIFGLLPAIKNFESLDEKIQTFFMDSGQIAEMSLKYLGEETIKVSAGTFNTYKISFKGINQTSNIIYIKKEFPRRIVKVDVIGTPLTIELAVID